MHLIITSILVLTMGNIACAQDTNRVACEGVYSVHSIFVMFGNSRIGPTNLLSAKGEQANQSVMFARSSFRYSQGKLPLFCALEDRIWRSTGLGIQFRIMDRPMGFK